MEVEASVMNLCSISIEKVLDLGVLKVLRVAVASVLQLCVGLGDTGSSRTAGGTSVLVVRQWKMISARRQKTDRNSPISHAPRGK